MVSRWSTLLILLLVSAKSLAETTIYITNGEWEPYLSEYSPHYGVNSHVIAEAFKLEGIKVKWGFFPWKRSYSLAKRGEKWDASATWWPTDEVKRDFYVSDPISDTSFVFFHLKSFQFDWRSIEDLKHLRIGGTLEYHYGDEFMKALKNNQLTVNFVSTDEINLKMLLRGRIDIFPNDLVVGLSQIRNNFPAKQAALITYHPRKFGETTLNLIISKKSKRGKFFLEKINSGLKKLKASGRFEEMQEALKAGKYDQPKVLQ